MCVSVLSIMSSLGRILSGKPPSFRCGQSNFVGVGSDIIVKKFNMSRMWCLFVSSLIFSIAQVCGARIENPHMLTVLSAMTGCKILSVTLDNADRSSGLWILVRGLSINCCGNVWCQWTFPELGLHDNLAGYIGQYLQSPLWYFLSPSHDIKLTGAERIYDAHSIILPDGQRDCRDSVSCYSTAYWVTFGAGAVAVLISLWSIRQANVALSSRNRNGGTAREA